MCSYYSWKITSALYWVIVQLPLLQKCIVIKQEFHNNISKSSYLNSICSDYTELLWMLFLRRHCFWLSKWWSQVNFIKGALQSFQHTTSSVFSQTLDLNGGEEKWMKTERATEELVSYPSCLFVLFWSLLSEYFVTFHLVIPYSHLPFTCVLYRDTLFWPAC